MAKPAAGGYRVGRPAVARVILSATMLVAVAIVFLSPGQARHASWASTAAVQQQLQTQPAGVAELIDSYRDLADLLPQMESHLQKSMDDVALTVQDQHNVLYQVVEGELERQKGHPVRSGTRPPFIVHTRSGENEMQGWLSNDDLHWQLLRRYLQFKRHQGQPAKLGSQLGEPGGRAGRLRGRPRAPPSSHSSCPVHLIDPGPVLCFEVAPPVETLLPDTLSANPNATYLVWPQQSALGAATGAAYLPRSGKAPRGWAGLVQEAPGLLHPEAWAVVPRLALDDLLHERLALMRLDVEGHEIAEAINSGQVDAVLMEVHPKSWDRSGVSVEEGADVLARLQQAGGFAVFLLLRNDIRSLGLGKPAEGLALRTVDDCCAGADTEPADLDAVELAAPYDKSLKTVLTALVSGGWECNLWFEGAASLADGQRQLRESPTTISEQLARAKNMGGVNNLLQRISQHKQQQQLAAQAAAAAAAGAAQAAAGAGGGAAQAAAGAAQAASGTAQARAQQQQQGGAAGMQQQEAAAQGVGQQQQAAAAA
eukprot:scaffold14.g1332.t1